MGNGAVKAEGNNIFQFSVEDINSNLISLEEFRGRKAYLIVNVASL